MNAHEPPRKRIGPILKALYRAYPGATCALKHSNPLELLVATILSAQCTDARVNLVTESLFKKYRAARDYAKADPLTFQAEIRSTGFFRNKAKSIQAMAKMLEEEFNGEVPSTMEELIRLPGVARKTANVVLGTWFGKEEGVVVDTHVDRVSRRLGLTRETVPSKIERDLMELVPRKDWTAFGHMIIWHGRKICGARKPLCEICPLGRWCPSKGKVQ
ncbi:MAG: endonuclease III [Planctomycetes bacterium]|nr:endonuclease III [Planctomycetota bacterium]